MSRLARALTRGGSAQVLAPGTLEFLVTSPAQPDTLRPQGFGLRMTDRAGHRYDIAILNDHSEIATSGFNGAESLVIPLRPRDTIQQIMARLSRGRTSEVVRRGDLQEVHGHALDVMAKKIAVTNKHCRSSRPVTAAC